MMKHRTREGQTMFVAEMQNRHILNTIGVMLNRLEAAKARLDENNKPNKFTEALYGTTFSEADAKHIIQNYDKTLSKYFFEAAIRGINVKAELDRVRDLLERSDQISIGFTVTNADLDEIGIEANIGYCDVSDSPF